MVKIEISPIKEMGKYVRTEKKVKIFGFTIFKKTIHHPETKDGELLFYPFI